MDPATYEERPLGRVRRQQYAVGISALVAIGAVAWFGVRTELAPVLLSSVTAVGILGLIAIVAGIQLRPATPLRTSSLLALVPALTMLGLFYSLAVHIYRSLGGWPTVIGTRGFSSSLETHAELAFGCFSVVLLVNVLVLPAVLALCVLVRRWRIGVFYVGLCAISFVAAFGVMLLAPSQFLYWWWD